MTFGRWARAGWATRVKAPYVHLIFGARQTGKSTLLREILPDAALWLDLSRPGLRAEYLRDPDLLVGQCRALPRVRRPATVVVDEVQYVPAIFDAVQHLQLLEDMLVGFRVTAFSGSPRKSVLSTERFYFFDLGVRNAAAELPLSAAAVRANPGPLFEQWVGIELWKRLQYLGSGRLHYLRTKGGAEVDFIVEHKGRLTPIEVKWTDRPSPQDARHLLTFLAEHRDRAARGYLVCRCSRPMELHPRVLALPWFDV